MTNLKWQLFLMARKLLYQGGSLLNPFLPTTQVVILCYHSISSDGWRFSVSQNEFQKQINYLLSQNYKSISIDDLSDYLKNNNFPKKAFLLTFDDGYQNILQTKKFLLKKGIKPVVFVLSIHQKAATKELENSNKFLTKNEIKELVSAGWTIGSHSATHADFKQLNSKQAVIEIVESRKELIKDLNLEINYFAYPKGVYNQQILKNVQKAGYQLAFSMDDAVINKESDPFTLPRVGVDGSHSFSEFKNIFSASSIMIRKSLKAYGIGVSI